MRGISITSIFYSHFRDVSLMSFETLDRCYILIHIYQIFLGAARNNLSLATNMYYTSILLFGHHDISVRLSEQMYQ